MKFDWAGCGADVQECSKFGAILHRCKQQLGRIILHASRTGV
jgi:hypothetical protein